MKLGIASTDWASTLKADSGLPAMGGSGWIRIGQYLEYMDFETIYLGRLSFYQQSRRLAVYDWDGKLHSDFDVLLMQRYMNAELVEDLKSLKNEREVVIVQDIDDWYWGIDQRNHAYKATHPKFNPTNNIQLYKKVIRLSDYVITSTPFLVERISDFVPADRIILHENHADLSKYPHRTHIEADKPIIGWFGSTGHRSGDLQVLRGTLSLVEDQFGFAHVGDSTLSAVPHPPFYSEVGIAPQSMSYTLPLLTHDELRREGFNYDIGIVPLSDKPFNSAKSWIKGLEYAAAGIPFIASPSPEYRRFKDEYGVGRIAKSPKDWLRHLRELRDPDLRAEEAKKNLEAIQPLDTPLGAKKLEAILKSFV